MLVIPRPDGSTFLFDPRALEGADRSNLAALEPCDLRTLEEAQAARVADIRQQAEERINAAWPLYRQLNRLRTGTPEEIAAMGAEIDAIRSASNAAQAAVAAATSNTEVDGVAF